MTTFNKGDLVPKGGEYVCSPCGYHHTFIEGEHFTECISCMSGTDEGDEEFVEGMELWEKADQQKPEDPNTDDLTALE